jgi:hypothetical protein
LHLSAPTPVRTRSCACDVAPFSTAVSEAAAPEDHMAIHPPRVGLALLAAAAALAGGCGRCTRSGLCASNADCQDGYICGGGGRCVATTIDDSATDSSLDGGGSTLDGGGPASDGGDGGTSVTDGSGTCEPRPQGCDTVFDPVCACDGTVYDNDCIAAAAGVDVSTLGNCTPPPGDFSCGSRFCTLGAQYCYHLIDDTGMPDTWTCMPMPPCMTTDCACVNAAPPCAGTCADGTDGSVTLTCGAG